jgi:hypothetical protein
VNFQRRETRLAHELKPGEYLHVPNTSRPALIHAVLCCPACSRPSSVSKRIHQVNEVGVVYPSYVCPFPPCTFHAFIVLDAWQPSTS